MAWWAWVLIGVLALAGETVSMARFLLNVAIAAFVVATFVLLGAPSPATQAVLFIALSILLIGLIRPRMAQLLTRHAPARPTVDQGETLVNRLGTVTDPVTCDSGAIQVGKAEFWTARVAASTDQADQIAVGCRVRIAAVRGLTAYVEPLRPPDAEAVDPAPVASPPSTSGARDRGESQPLTFGTLLKRYRVAAGLTQEELSERARLSVRAISDLERGLHRAPQKDTLALLADALALSHEDRVVFEAAARRSGPRHGTIGTGAFQ